MIVPTVKFEMFTERVVVFLFGNYKNERGSTSRSRSLMKRMAPGRDSWRTGMFEGREGQNVTMRTS